MGEQADALFSSLEKSGRNFVVIAPNNDPGSSDIFDVIDRLPSERFRVIPSMRFAYFSEAPPKRGCHDRKRLRWRPRGTVPRHPESRHRNTPDQSLDLGVDPPAAAADGATIERFLKDTWGHRFKRDTAFGAGDAAKRFVEILESDALWALPKQKQFFDGEGVTHPLPRRPASARVQPSLRGSLGEERCILSRLVDNPLGRTSASGEASRMLAAHSGPPPWVIRRFDQSQSTACAAVMSCPQDDLLGDNRPEQSRQARASPGRGDDSRAGLGETKASAIPDDTQVSGKRHRSRPRRRVRPPPPCSRRVHARVR